MFSTLDYDYWDACKYIYSTRFQLALCDWVEVDMPEFLAC